MWYTVLCWWDRENELPIRVCVAEQNGTPPEWREARGGESVCVWDLEIIWHERQAWVDTLLSREDLDDRETSYLHRVIERGAR